MLRQGSDSAQKESQNLSYNYSTVAQHIILCLKAIQSHPDSGKIMLEEYIRDYVKHDENMGQEGSTIRKHTIHVSIEVVTLVNIQYSLQTASAILKQPLAS